MQLRIAICIPVYNHPASVADVIHECLLETDFPILVVDDGSDEPVEQLYLKTYPVDSRITFIKHAVNVGKGIALQTGIHESVKRGFTHLVTIDADGQHDPKEIKKLVQMTYQFPWSVVIGDRQMQTQNVPKSSVFGKAFSNFWVKYQTDAFEGDSQSGFRIYPLFYLQTMKFLTRRYDFEIEVLTRLIWRGVSAKAVPITVKYFPPGKRVTHFNKFKDNLRLTLLNTLLVAASLLRRDDSPLKSGLAVAIGIFVGCYPVYGIHTFVVILIALLFRMNFIYLWLGTQISLPPLIPFLIWGSRYAGELYLGHPPHGFFGFSEDWIEGITIFAFVMATIGGVLTYFFKASMKKAALQKKSKVSVKSQNGFGIAFMSFMLQKFGLKTAYLFLYFIVPYYYVFSRRARVSCNQYWKIIRPDLGFFARQRKVLSQIFVFAQVLVDRAYQKTSAAMEFKVVEGSGLEAFKKDMADSKKGHVTLQCHMGGWEISMGYFRHRYQQWNKKMVAVMFGVEGSYQHSSIKKANDTLEVALFNMQQDTIIKLKTFLDRGDLVGLMADRPVGRSYELLPFCGKLALFDSTAVRLAQLCDARLFFVFSLRASYKHYMVNTVMADVENAAFSELSREDKTLFILKQYTQELEAHLKKAPEQWFNFFPFWSETLF